MFFIPYDPRTSQPEKRANALTLVKAPSASSITFLFPYRLNYQNENLDRRKRLQFYLSSFSHIFSETIHRIKRFRIGMRATQQTEYHVFSTIYSNLNYYSKKKNNSFIFLYLKKIKKLLSFYSIQKTRSYNIQRLSQQRNLEMYIQSHSC